MRTINNFPSSSSVSIDSVLKDENKSFYNFATGEPNLDISPYLSNGYHDTSAYNSCYYSSVRGEFGLRNWVANGKPERAIIGNGSKQLIYEALRTVTNPYDEVVIVGPAWPSYMNMCKILNLSYRLVCGEEEPFYTPTIEQLAGEISYYTKCVIINNPNNPTGVVYSPDYMKELLEICSCCDCFLIVDEVYKNFVYDGVFESMQFKENVICISSFSKSHAIPGWRFAYAIADEDIITAMATLQGQIAGPPNTLIQKILYNSKLGSIVAPVDIYRSRVEELAREPFFNKYKPQAGFYFYVPIGDRWESSNKCWEEMAKTYGIVMVPGDEYGIDQTMRISIAHVEAEDIRNNIFNLQKIYI